MRRAGAPALSAAAFKSRGRCGRMLTDMKHLTQPLAPSSNLTVSPQAGLMHTLMCYKRWADADLIRAAMAFPALANTPEAGYITAIVRHFHTVDCIFRAHLLGVAHEYTSANPAEPATLPELEQRVAAIDQWYVDYTRDLDERALDHALRVKFTDGAEQVLTRADILLHISLHGASHRGNVGILMRLRGAELPPDRFTSYLSRLAA